MKYVGIKEASINWGVPERTIRNYCATGKIDGAYKKGKTWMIPENAECPRINQKITRTLLEVLKSEKKIRISGGIYHRIQIELTYNSNRIEGSKITSEQTRNIFETNTIGFEGSVNVDDVIETVNHFRCIDYIIDTASNRITEKYIKELHRLLKNDTSENRESYNVGDYKKYPNEVGGMFTTLPENVSNDMYKLLDEYNNKADKTFNDILDFHARFERIHPFQDGNGRVGRLIMFKECLKYSIVPFIIDDNYKLYYYRGLKNWDESNGYLFDTCLSAQDVFKTYLDYFRIGYKEIE